MCAFTSIQSRLGRTWTHFISSTLIWGDRFNREGRTENASIQLANVLVNPNHLVCDWLLRPKASEVSFLDLSKTSQHLAAAAAATSWFTTFGTKYGHQKALKTGMFEDFSLTQDGRVLMFKRTAFCFSLVVNGSVVFVLPSMIRVALSVWLLASTNFPPVL